MSPQGRSTRNAGAVNPRPSRRPPGQPTTPTGAGRTTASADRVIRPANTAPALRLVRPPDHAATEPIEKQLDQSTPILDAADPRWVLAVRTAQCLQGTILPPEQRDRLLILARLLRLTPFDANLIIAIVQDQARRGHTKEYCAAAGRQQLSMIPLPTGARLRAALHKRRPLRTASLVAGFIAIELLIVAWWLWMG